VKILLVFPPDAHMIKTNVPEFVDKGIGIYPPLGLMYIASSIMHWSDWEVELLDCKAENMTYPNLKYEIEKRNPDVVGIETLTFTLIDAVMTAKIVKEIDPNIHVVLGGPHVNIYPKETLKIPYVDYIILGEGEYVICEFLKAVGSRNDFEEIKGVGYKRNGKVFINPKQEFIENLDDLPHPDRKLLNIERYFSLVSEHSPITTMITSRGCPYKCLYCDRPHLGKRFRARSPKSVVREMKECKEMGIKEILFYDDTFTINRKRVQEICDLIIKQGINISWDVRAHVDTVDEFTLSKMADAGCERIHFGVESGTPEIQKVLRKNLDLNRVKNIFSEARKVGLKTLAYFMIGNPTETKEQIEKTIDYMLELNADYAHISIATPFPGTEMYYLGLEQGLYKEDYWEEFAQNPRENFSPELWTENLSEKELYKAIKRAYKKFYLRPSYIVKNFLHTKSIKSLKEKASSGIKMLFS